MRPRRGAEPAHTEDAAIIFRALLDQGSLAVGVVDASGRLKMRSRGLEELVGASVEGVSISELPAVLGLFNAEGTAPLDPEQLPLKRAASGETVRDVVVSVRRPGKQVRYLRCDAVPLTGSAGHQGGAIMLVADVTGERTEVSRQDTIRSLLLDTVNHELRTPLTVVLANAELIVDAAGDLPDHLRAPISAIVRASTRLRDTIQHVTDLVDLESAAHAQRSDTEVRELLVAVADRERAEARNIAVEVDCANTLDWNLDAALVRRAVGALLDNALTHGPSDSDVILAADVVDDLLRVRVIDRGPGIPIFEQERLTKPFERGATAHDAGHSRGLGLALAQAVATSHHGALLLRNQRPVGFIATLMLA